MAYPVSVQSIEKQEMIILKYDDNVDEKFKLHFRCHYSNSGFVSYYLMRLSPFTDYLIKFQGNKFDLANRMFHRLRDTWEVLERCNDNRELTPEFFTQPEIFINFNCNDFGKRQDTRVDDLDLPYNCRNVIELVSKHRTMLNGKGAQIQLWIDNIFGSNQLIKNKESLNIYMEHCYEQEVNLKKQLDRMKKDLVEVQEIVATIRDKSNAILNFGQVPAKLFDDKHPDRSGYAKNTLIEDDFSLIGGIIQNLKKPEVAKFKKGTRYFGYSETLIYVLNNEREIEILEKQTFKMRHKFRIKNNMMLNTFNLKDHDYIFRVYRDKHMIVELKDCKYFLVCRYLDNSIKVYFGDNNIKEVLVDSVK